MNKTMTALLTTGIMIVAAAPAEARFLSTDTAKRLSYRVGVKLSIKVQADTWELKNRCDREDARHITCYLTMYDSQTLGGRTCHWDVLVTAGRKVTHAQSEFMDCAG